MPLSVNQWDQSRPDFLEDDTVAHCGTLVAGQFVYTVDNVYIATGWTEQRAVCSKVQKGVFQLL